MCKCKITEILIKVRSKFLSMAAWLNFCVIRCVIDVCSDSVLTLIFKSVDGCHE